MSRTREAGGVSLFVVIFTALLITIITVGFTRFVISYQQQTQRNDLSERAYNSALAGVEDAKRVLVAYTKECATSSSACNTLRNAITSQQCDTISRAGITTGDSTDSTSNKEKQVGDPNDNQAYTCVKILLNTDDYTGSVDQNGSSIVHLKGVSAFNRVKLTWFTKTDSGSNNDTVQLYTANPLQLPPAVDWPSSAPPILRAQYIPAATSVNIEDLDNKARTVFLYPSANSSQPLLDVADDARRASGARVLSPYLADCDSTYGAVGGVCTRTLSVPATDNAYLQLSALYNGTSYKVELFNNTAPVQFDGVAPKVDATGRAAELFRRVDARIEVGGAPLPAPIAALFTTGNLCKDFQLGDADNAYDPGGCEP